jgi:hypothetical protein
MKKVIPTSDYIDENERVLDLGVAGGTRRIAKVFDTVTPFFVALNTSQRPA